MSTCRWCTLSGSDTTEFLKDYASNQLSPEDLEGSNDDLCYCLECVVEYHKARENFPRMHQVLWELETSRLIAHFEKSMQEEDEAADELYLVDENGDTLLSGYVGPDFENNLRVPLLEILKYPYLLLHERVSELCVQVLCRMEESHSSFQVFEKHPGIYLFLVHPNEVIRRWAILTARNLGKVDRDDYYDLQEVLTCLFRVIELGLFESPDIYSSSMIEKGKLILLPSYLYDTTNYKNYWLGICMLLTVMEEEAMDSLLLGPDKQNDFVQSILHTMEKEGADDSTDPFWPALHCFMVILDQLGSKVWGQLIDPVQAFQTIINSVSYNNEIKNIRSSFVRTKSEPEPYEDDGMITCSQIVYNYNTEKPQKDTGWKAAICPDYCPSLYEDMQTLATVLQSDIGRDMRVHESTFLWFIPFVQSLMDLKDLGMAYIVEVIHYLCSEIKDTLNKTIQQCDKIAEFFLLILVSIIELHRNKKCLHLLWISSQEWVEAVVRCAKLPASAFTCRTDKAPGLRGSPGSLQASNSVQHACVQLIRSLLKEGYQIGQQALCKQYLNKLNLLLRGNLSLGWQLNDQETQELQVCLRQVIRSIKNRPLNTAAGSVKLEKNDDGCKVSGRGRDDLSSPTAATSKEGGDGDCQESPFLGRKSVWEQECRDPSTSTRCWTSTKGLLVNIKKEPDVSPAQNSLAAKLCRKVQENRADDLVAGKCHLDNQNLNPNAQCSDCRRGPELETQCEAGPPVHLAAPPCDTSVATPPLRSRESPQRKSVTFAFQTSLVSSKVAKKSPVDCSVSSKDKPALQRSEDDDLLSETGDTSVKKTSTGKKSNLPLKPASKTNPGMEKPSDWKQTPLTDWVKSDCRGHVSKTSGMEKTLANGCVPSGSENKRDLPSPASQRRPLSVKGGSSDRLLEFSEYFKRENSSMVKKKKGSVEMEPEDNALMDCHVDRELSKLCLTAYAKGVNFPFDSRQESSVHHSVSDVKRKVKGAVRFSCDDQSTNPSSDDGNQTIVISDSSEEGENVSEEEEPKQVNETVSLDKQPLTSSCISELISPGFHLSLEECESQCFEFETDEDVYSVWSDTQALEPTQEYKQDQLSTTAGRGNSGDAQSDDTLDHTIEWGYEVDYITDEMMEEVTNIEKQLEPEDSSHQEEGGHTKKAAHSVLQESVSKRNMEDQLESVADKVPTVAQDFTLDSAEPRASTSNISLASKLALKKRSVSPRNSVAKLKVAKTIQRSPKNPHLKPAQSKLLLNTSVSQPGRSLPAVVPPRKVRQCPAPASTAEKLGLKKAPRKALELSQRSLESIVKLRSHGEAAGRVGLPQKRKTKPIAAQSLSIKHNKKFLVCQDFLRKTRPPKHVREPLGGSESRNKVRKVDVKLKKPKPPSSELASGEGSVKEQRDKGKKAVCPSEEPHVSQLLSSLGPTRRSEDGSMMVAPVTTVSSPSSTVLVGDKDKPSGKGYVVQPESEKTTSTENGCEAAENSEDDDDLFLTQLDPVDMELCSQVESVEDSTIGSKKPEEMDTAESLQQGEASAVVKCKHTDCVEKVEKPGEYCRKHSASSSGDHVFAIPLLPPPKARKPSTTKIFSSVTSSRSAAFSKDLEDGKKLPPASKSKVIAAKQMVVRPPSVRTAPAAAQPHRAPSLSNVPQPYGYGNVLQSHNRQNEIAPAASRGAPRSSHAAGLGAQQRDNNTFVNEVLNWTYESIATCSQFGPPSNLLQSVVAPVPVHFQGYNDYFNTFFPLMMLNAFESLAQGWIENQRGREKSYYLLCRSELPDFRADVNTAHFEAHLREVDLARQLHPKEDDVVFLVVQNKKDSFKEEKETEDSKVYHVGLVTRFYRASGSSARQKEQHTVYHVSVQTRGNLSFSKNKQVKCVVVGSLVTTRREFRSLLLLSRSPLAKAIINPSYNDFCPRDLPVASESAASDMNDYNEGQKRAIETAYAMVKQHPGLPKICLIHGPPGTGKSKTIVGLLSRVLRENTRNERTARKTNPKIKPNRFLVCAPSNAAVDELMKKIIVAFKEKCQNRQEPLGNCGDIKLVRIGAEKAINSEVLGFSLDKQVQHRMKRKTADLEKDIQKKKESIDRRLDELIRQRAMNKCGKRESQMIDDEFNRVSKEREHLASQLKEVRAHSQKVQAEIILESDIICCTLSASGGGLLESTLSRQGVDPFSCVIVDEAGQSCEVETLIPLIHRCNKLVLVGDPRQLPPTVKSVKAQENGYDQSLMARLHRHLEEQLQSTVFRSLPVVQLTVQYRMHPDICLFPSNYVYGRTLKTDRATEESRCSSDWPFQPYLIFDVGDGREERDNDSFSNPQEVKLVMELIKAIKARRKDLGLRRIGIITPYSAQKKRIQRQLDQVFGSNSPGEVDTVDAFQGREKDCVIVTCVRANATKGSIGFLASLQRLNVTITRARFSLFILGRLETLMENKDWNELIQDAHKRGAIIKTSEESYKRDALKILKLRPTVWCP
ncbi:SETX helicase, partial [Indicator maculatus]|nr:SETX helicase [Indicator maculatus]